MALSVGSSRQPQPSSITSITGRRRCIFLTLWPRDGRYCGLPRERQCVQFSLSPQGRGRGEGVRTSRPHSDSVPPHPVLLPAGEKGRSVPAPNFLRRVRLGGASVYLR